jgi:hypothetical protein
MDENLQKLDRASKIARFLIKWVAKSEEASVWN